MINLAYYTDRTPDRRHCAPGNSRLVLLCDDCARPIASEIDISLTSLLSSDVIKLQCDKCHRSVYSETPISPRAHTNPTLPNDCEAATQKVSEFLRQLHPLLGNPVLRYFEACEPWDVFALSSTNGSEIHIGRWMASYQTDRLSSFRDILKLANDPASPVIVDDIHIEGDIERWRFVVNLDLTAELEPEPNS